jgi:hypothetical protein
LSQSEATEKAEKLLHSSAESGDVVSALSALARGADPNCLASYPLSDKSIEKAKLMNCQATALHAAAAQGCSEVVELLLQNGGDCKVRTIRLNDDNNSVGATALEVALANGHSEVAKSLQAWAER